MSDKESTMDDTLTPAELHDLLARSRAEVDRLREALTEEEWGAIVAASVAIADALVSRLKEVK